jgi:uncharacterized protein YkwD
MFEHWKDHFHPHEGNDHRPYAYRAAGAIALGLVVLTIVSFSSLQSYYITHSENFLAAVLPAVLVDLANDDRSNEGLSDLRPNEILKAAAQMKADHMAELEYFSHDAPDGTTPWEWFARAGYEYETAGENLAINFSDSADVERAWMDSPAHRENILEEGFTEIGIATARGEYEGDDTVFVVQLFARPTANNLAQRGSSPAVQGDSTTEAEIVDESQEETAADEAESVAVAADDTDTSPQPDSTFVESEPEQETDPEPETTTREPIAAAGPVETTEPLQEESAPETETVEPVDTQEQAATTTSTPTTTQESIFSSTTPLAFATPTPIAQVQGESGIALQPFSSEVGQQASRMMHLLSEPEFIFRTLMLTLFGLIALSLLISVGVEAKRHHVQQALKSLGALAILLLVFYIGIRVIFADPDIAYQSDNRLSAEISLSGSMPSL